MHGNTINKRPPNITLPSWALCLVLTPHIIICYFLFTLLFHVKCFGLFVGCVISSVFLLNENLINYIDGRWSRDPKIHCKSFICIVLFRFVSCQQFRLLLNEHFSLFFGSERKIIVKIIFQ